MEKGYDSKAIYDMQTRRQSTHYFGSQSVQAETHIHKSTLWPTTMKDMKAPLSKSSIIKNYKLYLNCASKLK